MTSNNVFNSCKTSSIDLLMKNYQIINNQEDYSDIIQWINSFEFSRQKKNVARDFSDATMVSEIIKYYWPKMIDLHNYMPANSLANKISNWETLNRKVLRKLKLTLSEETIKKLSASNMDTIHKFLKLLKNSVDKLEKEKRLILECSQKHPLYIIENEDMIQVETAGATCKNKYLDKETVKLVNRLKQNINDLEHKIDHLSTLICVKDRRINDLQLQLYQLKKEENRE